MLEKDFRRVGFEVLILEVEQLGAWVVFLALSFTNCAFLGVQLNVCRPQFPHLRSGHGIQSFRAGK